MNVELLEPANMAAVLKPNQTKLDRGDAEFERAFGEAQREQEQGVERKEGTASRDRQDDDSTINRETSKDQDQDQDRDREAGQQGTSGTAVDNSTAIAGGIAVAEFSGITVENKPVASPHQASLTAEFNSPVVGASLSENAPILASGPSAMGAPISGDPSVEAVVPEIAGKVVLSDSKAANTQKAAAQVVAAETLHVAATRVSPQGPNGTVALSETTLASTLSTLAPELGAVVAAKQPVEREILTFSQSLSQSDGEVTLGKVAIPQNGIQASEPLGTLLQPLALAGNEGAASGQTLGWTADFETTSNSIKLAANLDQANSSSTMISSVQGSLELGDGAAKNLQVQSRVEVQDQLQVAKKIFRVVRNAIRRGDQELTIRLDPPQLGQIDVRLRLEKGQEIGVRIAVDSEEVRVALLDNIDDLKEALSSYGADQAEVQIDLRQGQQQQSESGAKDSYASDNEKDFAGGLDDPEVHVLSQQHIGHTIDRKG